MDGDQFLLLHCRMPQGQMKKASILRLLSGAEASCAALPRRGYSIVEQKKIGCYFVEVTALKCNITA
jgi:hypothetical protein